MERRRKRLRRTFCFVMLIGLILSQALQPVLHRHHRVRYSGRYHHTRTWQYNWTNKIGETFNQMSGTHVTRSRKRDRLLHRGRGDDQQPSPWSAQADLEAVVQNDSAFAKHLSLIGYYGYEKSAKTMDDYNATQWYLWDVQQAHRQPDNPYTLTPHDSAMAAVYAAKKADIQAKIAQHYAVPSFHNTTVQLLAGGASVTITDTNSALPKFMNAHGYQANVEVDAGKASSSRGTAPTACLSARRIQRQPERSASAIEMSRIRMLVRSLVTQRPATRTWPFWTK